MAIPYLNDIDLNQNELLNAVLQKLGSDPAASSLKEGQIWINTSSHKVKYFDGTNIITLGEVTVDSALSSTSTNPVQNKVINTALGNKADKSSAVSNVAYDSTNKKITKTINGSTSDVVSVATLKSAIGNASADSPNNNGLMTAEDKGYLDEVYESFDLAMSGSMDGIDLGYLISAETARDMVHFGTCSTAAGTTAKTVAIPEFKLVAGAWCAVKFSNTNTGAVGNLTLNVNSTGAKNIKYRNSNLPSAGTLAANRIYLFVYDGTYWQIVGDLDTNTTYTAASSAPPKVASASAQGSSSNYARQDHTHGIDLATGDSNGQVKIAGTNVSVKGLSGAAYKGVDITIAADTASDDNVPTSGAVVGYVESVVAAVDAMRFNGTIGTGGDVTTLPTSGVKVGDTYRVITAGTYAGQTCEIGDLIIAIATTPTWTVAQTNIDGAITSISGTSPISVTGTGSSRTIAHENSGVTAASKGDTSNQTPGFGSTFKVPSGTVNATGHLTAFADHTVKIPDTEASTSAKGLMSSSDKTKLNGIESGAQVNTVTSVAGKTGDVTLAKSDVGLGNVDNTADANKSVASAGKLTTARKIDGVSFDGQADIIHYGTCSTAGTTAAKTVECTGFALASGARVIVKFTSSTAGYVINGTLNVNSTGAKTIRYRGADAGQQKVEFCSGKVYEFVYDGTYWELVGDIDTQRSFTSFTGKPTSNQTPGFGDTFTIQQISQNTSGQVSGTDRTVKIPNTEATSSAAGLMSAIDKQSLDYMLTSGAVKELHTNPALTPSSGLCTWTLESIILYPVISIYEVSTGKQVMAEVKIVPTPDSNFVCAHQIKIVSSSNIAAGTYQAVAIG